MFKKFKPTWMVNAIYDLTAQQLQQNNIKAVLTDLDNTLIAWNNPDGTPELKAWLMQMQAAKIPVIVVSNNNYDRVKKALATLDLPFIARAKKPLATGVKKALQELDLPSEQVVMVGDQLITDMHAGNVAKVKTILVKPLVNTDAWNTTINRWFEKVIMWVLKKQDQKMCYQEGLDD